ncbi:serine O-acetyltransferase [Gilliamella sp. wkB112]|uniref:serine O-acetyltransferase n=1 Tax=Gilliamella sp. wkB112 TaxID=3120257 RepID=UPI00080DE2DE|nr:serine acetyltransferase [Gilliamella apicola]OCG02280.1 hypothetical protein A9G12_11275 [Gilliamella apicola]
MKYIHIIKFLLTHDLTFLKECWKAEITNGKKITFYRILKSYIKTRDPRKIYLFWWRLANQMYLHGNSNQKRVAKRIQKKLVIKFGIEIMLGSKIGKNLKLGHPYCITINENVTIGENLIIHQNVTIGCSHEPMHIIIGDNVCIGANSLIIGGEITIGNNVKIGAMSFVNKDVPDNCTVYTQKTNTIIQNN